MRDRRQRATHRESRPHRSAGIVGAIIDWPITLIGGLMIVVAWVWDRPRWISVPVTVLCAVCSAWLLVIFTVWVFST